VVVVVVVVVVVLDSPIKTVQASCEGDGPRESGGQSGVSDLSFQGGPRLLAVGFGVALRIDLGRAQRVATKNAFWLCRFRQHMNRTDNVDEFQRAVFRKFDARCSIC
jgi:hypothetical protein